MRMGGFYERLVGVVKGSLKNGLFKDNINKEELVTPGHFCISRGSSQNQPHTYQSGDVKNFEALFSNHLLFGSTLTTFPIQHDDQEPVQLPNFKLLINPKILYSIQMIKLICFITWSHQLIDLMSHMTRSKRITASLGVTRLKVME